MVRPMYPWSSEEVVRIPEAKRTRRLILASHRGPVEHHMTSSGELRTRQGSGGLATALSGLAPYADFTWVAAAMTEADRRVAATRELRSDPTLQPAEYDYRFVTIPRDVYSLHYSAFCNPILWFLQHSLFGELRRPGIEKQMRRAWVGGYLPANRAFARAIADELRGAATHPYVMLQDYHLYMCASYVRELVPEVILQQFVHIPWPAPPVWREIPQEFAVAICQSLLMNDIVGFQTRASADNFLRTCEAFVSSASIDRATSSIQWRGRRSRVRTYPVSVDVPGLRDRMESADVRTYQRRLARRAGAHTVVKVDRVDPIKNVIAGLDAFELLLQDHPELAGDVRLFAFLVPSRLSIPEYKDYAMRVRRRVADINARHARGDWLPIKAFEENNYAQALAGMSLYDVLLVNSVADGMNLVSKEGPIVNQRDGVVVLSKTAGSYNELREGALAVDPADVPGTAAALWRALQMPAEERRRRAMRLRKAIEERDLRIWLHEQLEDLDLVARERTAAEPAAAGAEWIPLISA